VETGTIAHETLSLAPFFSRPGEVQVLYPRLDSLLPFTRRGCLSLLSVGLVLLAAIPIYAASGGSISGTLADPTGAVIVGAALKLVNIAQGTVWQAVSDKQGLYSFPNIPVGHYDLTTTATGFTRRRRPASQSTLIQPSGSILSSLLAASRTP
jgi:hypothetical protein